MRSASSPTRGARAISSATARPGSSTSGCSTSMTFKEYTRRRQDDLRARPTPSAARTQSTTTGPPTTGRSSYPSRRDNPSLGGTREHRPLAEAPRQHYTDHESCDAAIAAGDRDDPDDQRNVRVVLGRLCRRVDAIDRRLNVRVRRQASAASRGGSPTLVAPGVLQPVLIEAVDLLQRAGIAGSAVERAEVAANFCLAVRAR